MKKTQKEITRLVMKYYGIMTEQEMLEEFGINPSTLQRTLKVVEHQKTLPKHLCWDCKFATNMYKCVYVFSCVGPKKSRYFKGTEIHKSGHRRLVVKCPMFAEG